MSHEDLREADDRVERRTKLVTGGGEEDALGPARGLGVRQRLLGQLFMPLRLARRGLRTPQRDLSAAFLLTDLPRPLLDHLLQVKGPRVGQLQAEGVEGEEQSDDREGGEGDEPVGL